MIWIALVILIIAGFAIPRLGKTLLVLFGVGVVCVIGFFVILQMSGTKQSPDKIFNNNEAELSDLEISGGYPSYLTGRIRNKSTKNAINTIYLDITFTDCLSENQCDIVGQWKEYISQDVPPGQVRFFKDYISVPEMGPAKGNRSWTYSIAEIKGS